MDEATRIAKIQALENIVFQKDQQVEKTQIELDQLKKRLKEEKEAARSAERHLRSFIRGEEDLFDGVETAGTGAEPVKVNRDYRTVSLKELGLNGGKAGQSLVAAGLNSLAAIADYTKKGLKLTDLDSIGQGKAEKIIAACEKWFADNPPSSEDALAVSRSFRTKADEADAEDKAAEGTEDTGTSPEEKPAAKPETPEAEQKTVETPEKPTYETFSISSFDTPDRVVKSLEEGFNECKSIFRAAIAGSRPKVCVFDLQDSQNRWSRGSYIIVEKAQRDGGTAYTMQRVYDQRGWIQRYGEYEKSKELVGGTGEPPGMLAKCEVINLETGVDMYISGDDEAFVLLDDVTNAVAQ